MRVGVEVVENEVEEDFGSDRSVVVLQEEVAEVMSGSLKVVEVLGVVVEGHTVAEEVVLVGMAVGP